MYEVNDDANDFEYEVNDGDDEDKYSLDSTGENTSNRPPIQRSVCVFETSVHPNLGCGNDMGQEFTTPKSRL